jgi:hypothetical protein
MSCEGLPVKLLRVGPPGVQRLAAPGGDGRSVDLSGAVDDITGGLPAGDALDPAHARPGRFGARQLAAVDCGTGWAAGRVGAGR